MSFLCRDLSTKFHHQTATHFWQTKQYFGLVSLNYSAHSAPALVLNQCISALNQAISNSNASLQEALSQAPNHALSPDYQVKTLILGAIQDSEIFLASQGDARVILSRFSQVSQILRSQNQEIQTTTGCLQPDDLLLLSDQSYVVVPEIWNQTKQALATSNLDQAQSLFSNFQHQPQVAALIQIQSITTNQALKNNPHPLKNFLLLLVPLFLILASLLFKQATNKLSYNQLHKQLDEELITAEGLLPLNPDSARQAASKAKTTFDKITGIKQEDWQLDYARRLSRFVNPTPAPTKTDVSTDPTQTPSATSIGSAQPWLDLKAVNPQANYDSMIIVQDQLMLLDNTNKRLDKISLINKDASLYLKGATLENTNLLVASPAGTFVSSANNLYKADTQGLTNLLKFSNASLTVAPKQLFFWNNTLYVLDSEARNIFKYTSNQKGFDPAVPWLKSPTKLPIDTISFSIDTNIYTINKQGEISLYQKGEKQPFTIQNGPLPTNPRLILSSADSNNLIILYQNQVATISKAGSVLKLYDLGDSTALQSAYFNSTLYILTEDQKVIKLAI